MYKRLKKIGVWLSVVLMFQMVWLYTAAQSVSAAMPPLDTTAKAAILIEASTGQVIFEKNADEALPPASMAKMMVEYILLERINNGQMNWDDMAIVSERAAKIPGSGQQLVAGRSYKISDLFNNLAVNSGNDAAVALAEHMAGTETEFVHLMNEKAQELGLTTAYFANASGLSNSNDYKSLAPDVSGETVISARDMAKLARTLIQKYPEVLDITSQTQARVVADDPNSIQYDNWNWMLEGWIGSGNLFDKNFAYPGLDGLKTGYISSAGNCFTGTAERDGMRLISVVMNTESREARFNETRKLMDYGFNNVKLQNVIAAKSVLPEVETVTVKKAKNTKVPVVVAEGISLVMKKSDSLDNVKITYTIEEGLKAPLEQGSVVGSVTATYDGLNGEYSQTVDLITAEEAEKAGWFKLLLRAIGDFFKSLFDGIKGIFS